MVLPGSAVAEEAAARLVERINRSARLGLTLVGRGSHPDELLRVAEGRNADPVPHRGQYERSQPGGRVKTLRRYAAQVVHGRMRRGEPVLGHEVAAAYAPS